VKTCKDNRISSVTKCRSWTLISGSIKFMWIFAGGSSLDRRCQTTVEYFNPITGVRRELRAR